MEKEILIKLYEAIEKDDYLSAKFILQYNMNSNVKISSRHLCGLTILAAEKNAIKVSREIAIYNEEIIDKDLSVYINLAKKIFAGKGKPINHNLSCSIN